MLIFEQNAQQFHTIGLGTLIPSEAVVSEELNGDFTLTFQHPYDTGGKWKRIEMGRIVLAETPRGKQPFRIYYQKPTMDGIEGKARHIFYDLLDNLCPSIHHTGTAQEALQQIQHSMTIAMPFSFFSNISSMGTVMAEMENPIAVLLQEEEDAQSFVKAFGGELLRDGFQVSMLESIGMDRGVCIAYRKNLLGLEVTEDSSDTATRIYPIGKDGLKLSGNGYIDSDRIAQYVYPKIKVLEDSSAQTQEELEQIATDFFAAGGDLPLVNIKVNFLDLSKTAEYAAYTALETVCLGDTVSVVNQKMGFTKKAKVIGYTFDALRLRYQEVELGAFSPTVTTPITQGANSGSVAISAKNTANEAMAAIQGIATMRTDGLYICVDSTQLETANSFFRFGQNGLQWTDNQGSTWKTIIEANGTIGTG